MKTTARQKREKKLLIELCDDHGYMFADSLPSKDRLTMMRYPKPDKSGYIIAAAPAVKLMVPAASALGKQILDMRKERNPTTSASAKKRAKANARQTAKERAR